MGGLRLRILAMVWADLFQTGSIDQYYTSILLHLQRSPRQDCRVPCFGTPLASKKPPWMPIDPQDERVTIMLVLSRKRGEKIVFPDLGVELMVVDIRGDRVRLGITAPLDIAVYREEVLARLDQQTPANHVVTGS